MENLKEEKAVSDLLGIVEKHRKNLWPPETMEAAQEFMAALQSAVTNQMPRRIIPSAVTERMKTGQR
jgi:hypothetical protein